MPVGLAHVTLPFTLIQLLDLHIAEARPAAKRDLNARCDSRLVWTIHHMWLQLLDIVGSTRQGRTRIYAPALADACTAEKLWKQQQRLL